MVGERGKARRTPGLPRGNRIDSRFNVDLSLTKMMTHLQ